MKKKKNKNEKKNEKEEKKDHGSKGRERWHAGQEDQEGKRRGQKDRHLGRRQHPRCCRQLGLPIDKFLLWPRKFSLWLLTSDVTSFSSVTYSFPGDLLLHPRCPRPQQ